MKNKGLADSTLEGQREIFSSYFNWLARECLIRNNPIANLGPIKCAKKVRLGYTDVDLEKLKSKCNSKRDKAIVCFLISTGCRISEMTGLNIGNVDFANKECTVLGKGNKEKTVYLDAISCMTLNDYLAERTDRNTALFVTQRGAKRLQPGSVRIMLKKVGALADVENVHPHKFRRTFATNLARRGMPLQEVAVILGHEKIDTTMKYCVIDKTTVKNDYLKFF